MHKLRVGLIGCGNIALNGHIPAYLETPERFEIVAVADPFEIQLELGLTKAKLTTRDGYSDPLELIQRSDVDLIDICTPQHLHRELIEAAAKAGHHIVCEKPLAAVPADAKAAIHAAKQAGVKLAVIHNYLFFPEVVAAKRILDSGELGDVRVVTVNFLGVVDSMGASGFKPKWRHDYASSGGGVLMDMIHGVYLANHFLGSPTQRVSAHVTSHTQGDGVESLALCRLESGDSAALVNIGWGYGHGGIDIVGSKGRLRINYENLGTCPWSAFDNMVITVGSDTRIEPVYFEPNSESIHDKIRWSIAAALTDIADAIGQTRNSAATGEIGLEVLEMTLASYASAATGQSISVPLDNSNPLHIKGVSGIKDLDFTSSSKDSPVRKHNLFGLN
jgi:predicted dehydrogenase